MAKKNKICQSCGMPLKYDKTGPALENDGTPSKKYCSKCYKDGEFIFKDCKVEDIQKKNGDVMRKMHYPNFLIKHFNKRIPKLERWQENLKQTNKINEVEEDFEQMNTFE